MFPLNYFESVISPIKMFSNRRYLKVWQMFVIGLLHIGLLLLPVSVQIGRLQTANLTEYVPKAMALVTPEVVSQLSRSWEMDQVVLNDISESVVVVSNSSKAQELLNGQTGIVFTSDMFIVQEKGKPAIEQIYLDDNAIKQATTPEQLIAQMSHQWFESNRLAIILTTFVNTWLLFATSFAVLLLGVSGFLSLMKFNPNYHIASYGEALTICLNCFGLPTFLAAIIGGVTGNPATMLTAQGILFLLNLIYVYWRTSFNDKRVATILDTV